MPYEPVLGIDVGASYSKIAIRSQTASACGTVFCTRFLGQVPSLAICDSSRGQDLWFFGDDAAKMRPGTKAKVHQNWKSALFTKEAGANYAQAVIVAHYFFEWLRKWVEDQGINPAAQRVRVCLPEFGDVESYASSLAQIMNNSGWREVQILKVSEPRANAVGIMSGGRNCVLRGNHLGIGQMFEQGSLYVNQANSFTNRQRNAFLRLCLLDIGSFTTDVAGVTINLAAAQADGIETSIQKSWRHGIINDLDHVAMPFIFKAHGLDWMSVQFNEQEVVKERLYAGERYQLHNGSELGGAADANTITNSVRRFVDDLWQKIENDIAAFKPEYCYFTGGGCRINKIVEELTPLFTKIGCKVAGVPYAHEAATSEPAERVATALGAASVILDVEEPGGAGTRVPHTFHQTEAGWVPCRCNGQNKDCCFCSGAGAYKEG